VNRPDDLALKIARNVQHAQRLGALYRVAQQPQHDAAALRAQLSEAAGFAGTAASSLSTPDQCEQYVVRLRGLARLALSLRDALEGGAHDQK
jgi:hypothetical protein